MMPAWSISVFAESLQLRGHLWKFVWTGFESCLFLIRYRFQRQRCHIQQLFSIRFQNSIWGECLKAFNLISSKHCSSVNYPLYFKPCKHDLVCQFFKLWWMFPINLTVKIRIVVYGEIIKYMIVDYHSLVIRATRSNADFWPLAFKVFNSVQ